MHIFFKGELCLVEKLGRLPMAEMSWEAGCGSKRTGHRDDWTEEVVRSELRSKQCGNTTRKRNKMKKVMFGFAAAAAMVACADIESSNIVG